MWYPSPPIFFLDFNNTCLDLLFLHIHKTVQNTFELVGTVLKMKQKEKTIFPSLTFYGGGGGEGGGEGGEVSIFHLICSTL